MNQGQRDRIKAAALELTAAMSDAGDYFNVSVESFTVTTIADIGPRYTYQVRVEVTNREVIV